MDAIFYTPDILQTNELPQEEAAHCVRVLRRREGDAIDLTDGHGFFYRAEILSADPKHCTVRIMETIPQPPLRDFRITIAVAPTKNMDRMEWFVEKATEIGIDRVICMNCRFSERREIKIERLRKIAVSAMKQSQKATLPELVPMTDYREVIDQIGSGQRFIAHCEPTQKALLTELCRPHEEVTVLIGPEGDFSPEEIVVALQQGFLPISLGASRLRTETAALVALHTVHVLNQLNG